MFNWISLIITVIIIIIPGYGLSLANSGVKQCFIESPATQISSFKDPEVKTVDINWFDYYAQSV